jgi:hypothetical protein
MRDISTNEVIDVAQRVLAETGLAASAPARQSL